MALTEEQIKEYYRTAELILPPNAKFRQYKIQLFDGSWVYNRNRINSVEQLRKFLVRFAPKNAFYSVSSFLNPTKCEDKRWKANSIILDSDIWVETDSKDDILSAKEEILQAYSILKDSGLKFQRCAFSGKKGYYLYYSVSHSISDAKLRKDFLKQKKAEICDILISAGLKTIDAKYNERNKRVGTMWDLNRITRLPNSIRACGAICLQFNGIDELMAHNPVRAMLDDKIPPRPSKAKENRAGLRFPLHSYLSKNGRSGTLFAIVSDLSRVREAIQIYNLSDVYTLKDGDRYIVLCCKLLDSRRIEKILKFLRAHNYRNFDRNKYNRVPIYITPFSVLTGRDSTSPLSAGHNNVLRSFYGLTIPFDRDAGFAEPLVQRKIKEAIKG